MFGIAKDIVGKGSFYIENKDDLPASVSELKEKLRGKYPEFRKLSSLAVAVNSSYAEDGTRLNETDEIAIIPPVSGG